MKAAIRRLGGGAISAALIVGIGPVGEQPEKGSAIAAVNGLSFEVKPFTHTWANRDARPLLSWQLHAIENYYAFPQSPESIGSLLGDPSSISYEGIAYWNIANDDGSISNEQLAISFTNDASQSAYACWRAFRYAG